MANTSERRSTGTTCETFPSFTARNRQRYDALVTKPANTRQSQPQRSIAPSCRCLPSRVRTLQEIKTTSADCTARATSGSICFIQALVKVANTAPASAASSAQPIQPKFASTKNRLSYADRENKFPERLPPDAKQMPIVRVGVGRNSVFGRRVGDL